MVVALGVEMVGDELVVALQAEGDQVEEGHPAAALGDLPDDADVLQVAPLQGPVAVHHLGVGGYLVEGFPGRAGG